MATHAANLILTVALVLPALPGRAWTAELEGASAALEQCGAYPEGEMRDCLAKKYQASTTALRRAEERILVTLAKWDEDEKYSSRAKEKLDASRKAYQLYRDAQCAFATSLGGGAIGNALELRRLSCLVGLNAERTTQLRESALRLPQK